MVAALAVLGLVVDDAVLDLDLAGVEVALEVGLVVPGVPQAELDAEKIERSAAVSRWLVMRQLPDLQVGVQRHEIERFGLDAVRQRADGRVAQAVAAVVAVQRAARRLPRGRPELAGRVVAQVEVAPAGVEGHVVVAVAGQPAQARVAVERVAAGCVGDEAKIGLAAQVVDPGQRRVGPCDDVFPAFVVEISVGHGKWLSFVANVLRCLALRTGSQEHRTTLMASPPYSVKCLAPRSW